MFKKLKNMFINWLLERKTISIGDFHNKFCSVTHTNIYDNGKLKFIEEQPIFNKNIYIESEDNKYIRVNKSLKTIKYGVWGVELENGKNIKCADEHIFMDNSGSEILCKNLKVNDTILKTKNGNSKVSKLSISSIQEHMYDLELAYDSSHTYYTNDIVSHNTTTSASFMLFYILFNKQKTVAIVANKQATAKEILDRIKLMYDYLPMWMKPGIVEWNKASVKFDNGCKIMAAATSSDSIRGQSISLLYLDEFAFIQKNLINEFIESTFPVISSSKLARIIITSTPNGKNHFYKFYQDAVHKKSSFIPSRIRWDDVPGRDDEWREERIKELGSIEKFNQEYGAEFAEASNMAFNAETIRHIEKIQVKDPLYKKVKIVTGLRVFERPNNRSKYLISCDVAGGRGRDSSTMIVFDITKDNVYNIVATYQNDEIQTIDYPEMIYKIALYYNEAYVIIENNSLGDGVANDLWYDYEYTNIYSTDFTRENKTKKTAYHEIGIKTNRKNKRAGVLYLSSMLDRFKIYIPDVRVIDELYTFVKNENDTYSASQSNHDDFVMNLVLFAYLVKTRESFDLLRASYKDFDNGDDDLPLDGVAYIEGGVFRSNKQQAIRDSDDELLNMLMGDVSTNFNRDKYKNQIENFFK